MNHALHDLCLKYFDPKTVIINKITNLIDLLQKPMYTYYLVRTSIYVAKYRLYMMGEDYVLDLSLDFGPFDPEDFESYVYSNESVVVNRFDNGRELEVNYKDGMVIGQSD